MLADRTDESDELELITDEDQQEIINSLKIKFKKMSANGKSEASKNIRIAIKNGNDNKNIWQAILGYLNEENEQKRTYHYIMDVIISVLLNKLDKSKSENTPFPHAKLIDFLGANPRHTMKAYFTLGKCHEALPNYRNAYEYYRMAAKLCRDDQSQETLERRISTSLSKLVKSEEGTHYLKNLNKLNGKGKTAAYLIGRSTSKATQETFSCVFNPAGMDDVLVNSLISMGLVPIFVPPAAVLGASLGLFNYGTRKLLSKAELQTSIENLRQFANMKAEDQQDVIDEVMKEYKLSPLTSKSSEKLFGILKSNITLEEKVQYLISYMLYKDNDVFKNNGKKLFISINNKIASKILDLRIDADPDSSSEDEGIDADPDSSSEDEDTPKHSRRGIN